jgi:hypothetical protein
LRDKGFAMIAWKSVRKLFFWKNSRQHCRPAVSRVQMALRWMAVVGYLVLSLGVPISVPAGKQSGEAYPCMNHPCGCQSAEECWRHCCCFSLEQRLAWARDNHVTPPDYALAEAKSHGIDWGKFCAEKPDEHLAFCPCHAAVCGSCCDNDCCDHDCCEQHDCCEHSSTAEAPHRAANDNDQHSHSVVLIQALKCRGADQNWMGLSISIPPPPSVKVGVEETFTDSICHSSWRISSPSFAPPTPPPRGLGA